MTSDPWPRTDGPPGVRAARHDRAPGRQGRRRRTATPATWTWSSTSRSATHSAHVVFAAGPPPAGPRPARRRADLGRRARDARSTPSSTPAAPGATRSTGRSSRRSTAAAGPRSGSTGPELTLVRAATALQSGEAAVPADPSPRLASWSPDDHRALQGDASYEPRHGRHGSYDVVSIWLAVAVGLNPRWACTHTRFRGVLLRPLGHATAGEGTGPSERPPKSLGRQLPLPAAGPSSSIRLRREHVRRLRITSSRYAAPCGPGTRRTSSPPAASRRGPGRAEHQPVMREPVPPDQLEPLALGRRAATAKPEAATHPTAGSATTRGR